MVHSNALFEQRISVSAQNTSRRGKLILAVELSTLELLVGSCGIGSGLYAWYCVNELALLDMVHCPVRQSMKIQVRRMRSLL